MRGRLDPDQTENSVGPAGDVTRIVGQGLSEVHAAMPGGHMLRAVLGVPKDQPGKAAARLAQAEASESNTTT